MYIIENKQGEPIARIHNMIILDPSLEEVLGIIIGDCFFGKDTKVVGKIFNSTAYLINGEIVGKLKTKKEASSVTIKKAQLMLAWDILSNIKEHTCAWIEESGKWSKKSLQEVLS
jgi:hypothetical protein